MGYYNPEIIMNMNDLEGNEPTIHMITSNRSAGKTFGFLLESLKLFKEHGRKTILIYRHQYELNSSNTIFNPILKMYPQYGEDIANISHARGLFYEITLDGESFAFAVALNNIDVIKKYSAIFCEVDYCIMDEFQLESGNYLKDEVKKLQSLLITVARGGGEQSRPIKVFLLGNNVSMLNPYFIFFDVNRRFKPDTKFIRGNGWIAEFNYNESASEAIKKNGLFKAFDSQYMRYSADNAKLFNEDTFLERATGKTKYLFTIKHNGKMWGIREEISTGKVFISENADSSCKSVLTFTTGEHSTNTVMLSRYSYIAKNLKDSYNLGLLRFSSLNAKNVIYDILALDFSK